MLRMPKKALLLGKKTPAKLLAVANNGSPNVTIYDFASGLPVYASAKSLTISDSRMSVAWSPDGKKLAYTATSAYIYFYDWSSGSPVSLGSRLINSQPNGICWSPDSRYCCVGASASDSPYVIIYDLNSGSPTKISDPSSLPTGRVNGAAWSLSGRYISLAITPSPYVEIYDMNTGVPVKISGPATTPTGYGTSAGWSPNNRYMAIGHENSPYISIYDWNTGSPVKISNPASLPGGRVTSIAWSNSGRYMACSVFGSAIAVYDWNSGVPVKMTALPGGITNAQGTIAWSQDDQYLAVAHNISPYVHIWLWNAGVPTKLSNPATLPAAGSKAVSFNFQTS